MNTGPRPCSDLEAIARWRSVVGERMPYELGTGDYHPTLVSGELVDKPWTRRKDGKLGADCWGVVGSYGYKLPRHREGFNRGKHATVSDDLNSNSAIEDAENAGELFYVVKTPRPGDLLVYPTIRIAGRERPFVGHAAGVEVVSAEWNELAPDYTLLGIIQCCGPDDRIPGVIRSNGVAFNHHDENWGKPEHRTRILRVKP